MIELFDEVTLKSGEKAVITDILAANEMYVGEIKKANGDVYIDFIKFDQLAE